MAGNRAFSSDDTPTKKDDYHGACNYVRTSPDVATKGIKSVNLELTFDEALRLSLAVQSALFNLNRYKRSTKSGKEMGLCLSVKTEGRSIAVIEARIQPADG